VQNILTRRQNLLNFLRATVTLDGSMPEGQSIARARISPVSTRAGLGEEFPNLDIAILDTPETNPASNNRALWERQVAAWKLLGPPLRPSPEDVAEYENTVLDWSRKYGPPRGLILGATPELARLPWPSRASVLAVDRSPAMIERVWPGYPKPGQGGLCGDWLNLPLPDHSRDLVLGDGPFTQLPYPAGYQSVARSIRRVLSDNGAVTIRFFIKPDMAESPEQVMADLWGGRIRSFHIFKWRLAMALQEQVEQGVQLQTIWSYWVDTVNPDELADRLGWQPEVISTMENYRGLAVGYTFPTLGELWEVLRPVFVESQYRVPKYDLGERCPILTFRPASAASCTQQIVVANKPENR
jgi:SAM-dependent methyltransferase